MLHVIAPSSSQFETFDSSESKPRIICKIISKLSRLGLRLAAGIDIKGGTDSLFFIEDPLFQRTGMNISTVVSFYGSKADINLYQSDE